MKQYLKTPGTLLSTTFLLLSIPHFANAQLSISIKHAPSTTMVLADAELPWVQGKVIKISKKRRVVTIAHGEITNLSMPSMTMGFKTADKAILEELEVGDMIEFQTEDRDGKLFLLHVRQPNS